MAGLTDQATGAAEGYPVYMAFSGAHRLAKQDAKVRAGQRGLWCIELFGLDGSLGWNVYLRLTVRSVFVRHGLATSGYDISVGKLVASRKCASVRPGGTN